jgi:hypothetical protein
VIVRQTSFSTHGPPLKCGPAASTTSRSPGTHSTNLYGPVPIGFLKYSSPISFIALGGAMKSQVARVAGRLGRGVLVIIRTV